MSDKTMPGMRIIRILEVIGASEQPLTPTEINGVLGWPKQSVHRLCNTLVEEGYIEKRQRRLIPRQRLFALCDNIAHLGASHIARHQVLLRVAETVGETVNFVRPEAQGMFYADRVETDWPFRVQLPIGTHVPFHCTASGKTYLASLRGKQRELVINSLHLKAHTGNTHKERGTLIEELNRIDRDGHALDREEFYENMVAIAVPVRDSKGRYHAALAIHGPKLRFTIEKALSVKGMLLDAAGEISQALD